MDDLTEFSFFPKQIKVEYKDPTSRKIFHQTFQKDFLGGFTLGKYSMAATFKLNTVLDPDYGIHTWIKLPGGSKTVSLSFTIPKYKGKTAKLSGHAKTSLSRAPWLLYSKKKFRKDGSTNIWVGQITVNFTDDPIFEQAFFEFNDIRREYDKAKQQWLTTKKRLEELSAEREKLLVKEREEEEIFSMQKQALSVYFPAEKVEEDERH